jgi:hypothetical protein
MKIFTRYWLPLLGLALCTAPNQSWAMFPIKAGETLTASINVTAATFAGGATAALVQGFLTQPDGVTLLGPTGTIGGGGTYSTTISVNNAELGTYEFGAFATALGAPGATNLSISINNTSTITTSPGGFSYRYRVVTPTALNQPPSVIVVPGEATQLIQPVTYFIPNFP